jgi:hypothetical protein
VKKTVSLSSNQSIIVDIEIFLNGIWRPPLIIRLLAVTFKNTVDEYYFLLPLCIQVMVINLEKWRENKCTARVEYWMEV